MNRINILVDILLFSVLLVSCGEKLPSPKKEININMIMGDGKCNQKKCSRNMKLRKKMDFETSALSSMDFNVDHKVIIRLLENTKVTLDSQDNTIYLEKGKILVANQLEVTSDELSMFNVDIQTKNNTLGLSQYSYVNIEHTGTTDLVKIHKGKIKAKKSDGNYIVIASVNSNSPQREIQNDDLYQTYIKPVSLELDNQKNINNIKEIKDKYKSDLLESQVNSLLHQSKKTYLASKILSQYSPNHGTDDNKTTFMLNPLDELGKNIQNWSLEIFDSQYNIVYQNNNFKTNPQDESNDIEWDMINEKGEVLTEQQYVYHLKDLDSSKNKVHTFLVDITAPKAKIDVENYIFAPKSSNPSMDQLAIHIDLEKGCDWKLKIKNDLQNVVYTRDLSHVTDDKIYWNGQNQLQKYLADGKYNLEIIGTDLASNQTIFQKNIYINNDQKFLVVTPSLNAFSPNNDKIKDEVDFDFKIPNEYQMHQWDFYVRKNNKVIKYWNGIGSNHITWDGKNDRNQVVEDGKYEYELLVSSSEGKKIYSIIQEVIVDNSPPRIKIDILGDSQNFTPDHLGTNNELKINHEITDLSSIVGWQLNIYQKNMKLQSITGNKKPKKTISWNGILQNGRVESFEDYEVELVATDEVGLVGKSPRIPFSTGAILDKTNRGYLLIISSILFDSGDSHLYGKKNFDVIERVANEIKKYDYMIAIEGHTDSDGESTGYDNTALSRARALTVSNALKQHGAKDNIMEIIPAAFKYPLIRHERSQKDKQENRRVHFFIQNPKF
jgi:flagellar motor protein MotB